MKDSSSEPIAASDIQTIPTVGENPSCAPVVYEINSQK